MTRTNKIESANIGMCRPNVDGAGKGTLGAFNGDTPHMSMKAEAGVLDVAEQFRSNPFSDVVRGPIAKVETKIPARVETPVEAEIPPQKIVAPEVRTPKKVLTPAPANVAEEAAVSTAGKVEGGELLRSAAKTAMIGAVILQATQDTPAKNGNEVIDIMDPHSGDRMAAELDYAGAWLANKLGMDVKVPTPPWKHAPSE
jgi:hypothetical protein